MAFSGWSGLPALAAALVAVPLGAQSPPPLSAYGNLPEVETIAISRDGSSFATVARIKDERLLLFVNARRNLTARMKIGEAKLRDLEWAGDDQVILTTSFTETLGPGFVANKAETFAAAIIPAAGGKMEYVFQGKQGMLPAIYGNYGIRFVNGEWLGYFAGIELARSTGSRIGYVFDHGRPALFGVTLPQNAVCKVAPPASKDHWRDWLVDGAGQVGASLEMDSGTGRWKIDNGQGTTLASGVDPTGDVSLLGFGADGTSVVYSQENDADGITRWFEVPLAGGTASEFLAGKDARRLYIDRTNGRILGYLPQGEQDRPVLFDPAHQSALRRVFRAFPKLTVEIREWTPDFSHILVRTSGNGDTGTWYIVDIAALKANAVGYERLGIAPDQVGPISTVTYTAGDGLALSGILTLPPGRPAANLPVVILPHGGPHAHDEAVFDWWAQAFASRGYAVFQPNFRGSTNRDGAFRRAGYGQWGRKMQTDLSDGLAELAKLGIADPRRACIVGASYGGYAALAGVTLQQGLYRCAVAVAPVSDLTDMYWTDYRESGDSNLVRQSLRESLGDPKTFAAVSPRRSAARADAPILLIHGKDDTIVPFKQSTAMADSLKDAGKPYEMVVLREEDHWLSRAATRQQMLEAAVGFVQRHNPAD